MRDVIWNGLAIQQLLDIGRTDFRLAARINAAVVSFGRTESGDLKKLGGFDQRWRLRVGDWRVIYKQEAGRGRIEILEVLNRRDAYDD